MKREDIERERRARAQRDRERQRAARPQRAQRVREPREMSTSVAAKPREHHEGLVGWVARMVRTLPSRSGAIVTGFVRELGDVVGSVARPFTKSGRAGTAPRPAVPTDPVGPKGPKRPKLPNRRILPESFGRRAEPAHGGIIRTRGDDRKRQLIRRRLRAVALLVFIVLAVVAWQVVPSASVFQIRHVEIVGASSVGDLEVRQRIDSKLEGATIYDVDTDAIERAVAEFPFVRSVSVDRHFPSGLTVRVVEHQPLALGFDRAAKRWWLIAPDGRVLAPAEVNDWRGRVPFVRLTSTNLRTGDRLDSEPAIALLLAQSTDSTLAIDWVNVRKYALTAMLRDDVQVRFGRPEQLRTKLAVVQRMLAVMRAKGQDWKYLDVSVPGYPVPCLRSAQCATLDPPDSPRTTATTTPTTSARVATGTAAPSDDAAIADDSTVTDANAAVPGPTTTPSATRKPVPTDAFDSATQGDEGDASGG